MSLTRQEHVSYRSRPNWGVETGTHQMQSFAHLLEWCFTQSFTGSYSWLHNWGFQSQLLNLCSLRGKHLARNESLKDTLMTHPSPNMKYQLVTSPPLSSSGLVAVATPLLLQHFWAWIHVPGDYHHLYQNTEGVRPVGTPAVSFSLMDPQLLIKLQPSTTSIRVIQSQDLEKYSKGSITLFSHSAGLFLIGDLLPLCSVGA